MVAVARPVARPVDRAVPVSAIRLAPASSCSRPAPLPASTYRRRRAVAAGLVTVAALVVCVALGVLGGGPLPVPEHPGLVPDPSPTPLARIYVVQPGDTFWSIARALRPRSDPRPLVDRLVAVHGGPVLYVGERLTLPDP